MATINHKLQSLDEKSVWIFTKQETDFDESVKATKLFAEIPDRNNINVEQYFTDNHTKYGISTNRHRILVIPQMFGLITKTPFYAKGVFYNEENPTEVFDEIKNYEIGSQNYNILKTEQLLKIKIHAIIDTASNNMGYVVLPIIFIYKVLKELQTKYDINSISIDQLYTYVLTCENYSEVNSAVENIRNNEPISEYVKDFKGRSRVLTCIKKNLNLFLIEDNSISINPDFDEYFDSNFIQRYDLDDLHTQLFRDVDYSYFLHNNQGFNINLIDTPTIKILAPSEEKEVIITPYVEEESETEYVEKVDAIKELNINIKAGEDAYKAEPIPVGKYEVGRRFRTNPLLGKIAIKNAYYCCERNTNHETFISKTTLKTFMEAHHLVPVCFQQEIWDKYCINIDCVENIVSLCPTCHKAIHYGTKEVQEKMIEDLYTKSQPRYKSIGFSITLEEVKLFYKIK